MNVSRPPQMALHLLQRTEGSMHEPIERFFRSFGGRQVPYFVLSKAPSSLTPAAISLMRRAKGILKR